MIKDFKIERLITFYDRNGDALIGEISLLEDKFSLTDLKDIFNPSEDDPLLYKQYDISEDVADLINKKINFDFDFIKYDYFLETFNVDVNLKTGNGIRLKDH